MMIKKNITPSVRAGVNDDPEFPIGLKMSIGFARLLHEILEDSDYGGAAVIDSCLTQAIELAEKPTLAEEQESNP